LIMCILTRLKKTTPIKKARITPKVTMIIPAYNEEKSIGKKIEDSLALDYPQNKLEIIIVSDGSTDKTERIASTYKVPKLKIFSFKERRGKTACQNFAVREATGEIIVFSDTNALYKSDAILKLVRNFADSRVGCVCGELRYLNPSEVYSGKAESLYWRYEKFLKRKESELSSLLGAAGSIYALRKNLYILIEDRLISDFIEPIRIYENGNRVVYEPEAISFEEVAPSLKKEFKRKVRIITRSIDGLVSIRKLLNPFKYGIFSVQLLSHKLFRWLIPLFLISLFLSNLFLMDKMFHSLFLLLQVFFYLLALAGLGCEWKNKKSRLFYLPLYFCMVNLASLIGLLNYIKGERMETWDTER